MKILETYDIFNHSVSVLMENKPEEPNEFVCNISVDGRPPYVLYTAFMDGERIDAEKPLVSLIEDALDYEKNNTLGEFIKNLGYNNSSQEINAGYMVFMSAKQSNVWLKDQFSKEEVNQLFSSIEQNQMYNNEFENVDTEEEEIGR